MHVREVFQEPHLDPVGVYSIKKVSKLSSYGYDADPYLLCILHARAPCSLAWSCLSPGIPTEVLQPFTYYQGTNQSNNLLHDT